jgi:hypothetical protein
LTYLTSQLGVDPAYAQLNLYKKSFQEDIQRIGNIFNDPEKKFEVEQRSLSIEEVSATLKLKASILVVLVDVRYLYGEDSASSLAEDDYLGHYVVVTSVCEKTNNVLFFDPERIDRMDPSLVQDVRNERFDVARKAIGTDEDIIVIQLLPLGLK